ncbi:class I SAM-dependent methyltransferase [Aspergillus stella-maris]|uniref:class I SAM-dependent methyltransferase n=1 Tax=Aspergillus stella-maris TaxID=1810926 RepID=UPI003CCD49B0
MAAESKKPFWFENDVKSINSDAQKLLEEYSGLKPEDVLPHVLTLREEAFKICPYPCIGQMRFLSFHIKSHPLYERVLEYLRNNPSAGLLDAGCCVGQELRFLASQGIPGSQLFGLDLEQPFIDLGYRLFKDKDWLDATFIDIVFASSLLHLWEYGTQLKVALRLVHLLRDQPGVMIVGRQMGSVLAGEYPLAGFRDGTTYRHNALSIKGMWHDIEKATQTRWKVEASLMKDDLVKKNQDTPWGDANIRIIWWSATRVE